MNATTPSDVLRFWYGEPSDEASGAPRDFWFQGTATLDAEIRDGFGDAVREALAGGFEDWRWDPQATLALVILLDQFTRNVHRGTPLAFAGDARAQAITVDAMDKGLDRRLAPLERWFLWMPLQHAESPALQARAVASYEALVAEAGPLETRRLTLDVALDYARRHAAIIARFGRFPHRNAVLGRPSTAEETRFLTEPGSSF
jgi:uncharacterized protein (DUF924 family)